MDNEGDDRLAQVLAVRTTLTARRDQIKELKMLMKIDPTGPHAEMLKKLLLDRPQLPTLLIPTSASGGEATGADNDATTSDGVTVDDAAGGEPSADGASSVGQTDNEDADDGEADNEDADDGEADNEDAVDVEADDEDTDQEEEDQSDAQTSDDGSSDNDESGSGDDATDDLVKQLLSRMPKDRLKQMLMSTITGRKRKQRDPQDGRPKKIKRGAVGPIVKCSYGDRCLNRVPGGSTPPECRSDGCLRPVHHMCSVQDGEHGDRLCPSCVKSKPAHHAHNQLRTSRRRGRSKISSYKTFNSTGTTTV